MSDVIFWITDPNGDRYTQDLSSGEAVLEAVRKYDPAHAMRSTAAIRETWRSMQASGYALMHRPVG